MSPRTSSRSKLQKLLQQLENPHTGRPWSEYLADMAAAGEEKSIALQLKINYPGAGEIRRQLARQLAEAGFRQRVSISVTCRIRSHRVQGELKPHSEIRNIIAVGSGKGGVGKSLVSANLALALAALGARVGVLDADIHGPSQPLMLGVSGRPEVTSGKKMVPHQAHGLQVISIGFLLDADQPMIWRGPMVSQALQQLLGETLWNDLDYLVVDLPPGTGDIQLTLLQKVPVAGAVVVTTPQEVATLDAGKAIRMFDKLKVPVLGLVENMSHYVCSQCGHTEAVFGSGGGARLAERHQLPLLGQLPLDPAAREHTDAGRPIVVADPDSALAGAFSELALHAAGRLSVQPLSKAAPELKVRLQD